MNNKKHMKKGISLMELIIVLAIISILTLIVGVMWNRIIYKQRLTSANNNAKIVFNAVQTETIKYASSERNKKDADRFIGEGNFYFYWDGGQGHSCSSLGDLGSGAPTGAEQTRFAKAINNILDENGEYAIYIKNYVVQSVSYVPEHASRYLGSYPAARREVSDTTEFINFNLGDYTADKIS